jgi:predicted O-methyltransferase YrrM
MRMIARASAALGIDPRRLNRIRFRLKLQVIQRYDVRFLDKAAFVLLSPEIDNFSYELENEDEMVSWIAETFNADRARTSELLIEARSNQAIYAPLRTAGASRWSMKAEPPPGRRLGWYVITRLLKPSRVIETGIHDGLGSLVFLAALDANAMEGHDGELISFDIDDHAGWLVGEHPRWRRRIGDARDLLERALIEAPTQIFLHDSNHAFDHELFELETAAKHMLGGAIMTDNAHATDALKQVAERSGRRYSYFHEKPRAHFYPGGGIGVAV